MSELRRRNVFRMAALYIVATWLVMQVAEVLIGLVNLPHWFGPTVLGLLALGFPIALIFSWFYEVTPEGISLEKDVDPAQSITHITGRRLDFLVIAFLSAAVILFAVDKWWIGEPPEKSIAVLPFVNLSGDLEQEHFSDGISEELLHRLAQFSDLHVAARTSSFHFKNMSIPVAEIAAQLGVKAVLEGSVRRAGDRIRVTAQLINADDGYHIWSKTYERELGDIFQIQDEIAAQVVDALKVTLLGDEKLRIAKHATANLAAYDAYLHGRYKMAERTSSALWEAIDHFTEAIEHDPSYPQAYVALADTYVLLERYGTLDREAVLARAEPAVEHALELDDNLGEAYASLGTVRMLQGKNREAERAFERALQLNPNSAPAHQGYALLMRWGFADKERALALNTAALALDPLSTSINMAVVEDYLELGRFEDALARCRRIVEIDPDFPRAYTIMADLYWEVFAQLDEGVRWLRKAIELDPGNPDHARWLGMIYFDLGDFESGEQWVREAIRLAPTQSASHWAAVYLASYTASPEQVETVARAANQASPGDGLALVRLRDADFRAGRGAAAIQRFRKVFPDLVDGPDPQVDGTNWWWAIEIANALGKMGRQDRAADLLRKALVVLEATPRLGYAGHGIGDAEIYALLGEHDKALTALAAAVDAGWRSNWRLKTEMNDNLAPLHGDPRYQAIIARIDAEMDVQLARVRAWEKEEIPEFAARPANERID